MFVIKRYLDENNIYQSSNKTEKKLKMIYRIHYPGLKRAETNLN